MKAKYDLAVTPAERDELANQVGQADCVNDEPRLLKSTDKDVKFPKPKPVGEPKPTPKVKASPKPQAQPTPKVKASPKPQPKPAPTTRQPAPAPKTTAPAPRQGVHPGAFCAATEAGAIGYTSSGTRMVCKTTATDSRLRWRAA